MITLKFCPICNSSNFQDYHLIGTFPEVKHEFMPGVMLDTRIVSRYSLCKDCGVIFQNPRFSEPELKRFYADGYYRRTLNATEENADADEAFRAKFDAGILKNLVATVYSHLDVGCGRGYLLDEVGAIVKEGVDPDRERFKIADVKTYSSLDDVSKKRFNLVTAIHVLEHVSDPMAYLKKMAKLLDKNGHLVIEVPTWESPGGPLRLPHLYHFDTDVLESMCKKAGLSVIHTKFTPHLLMICIRDGGQTAL